MKRNVNKVQDQLHGISPFILSTNLDVSRKYSLNLSVDDEKFRTHLDAKFCPFFWLRNGLN